jgi:F-type H+-transporting ATPase subunit epsilon
MKEFSLEIITPSKTAFIGQVTSITVPGVKGEFQVLLNHAPLMSNFEIGRIKLELPDGSEKILVTGGGVVEIVHNVVLLLADSIETPEEIDIQRAKNAAERAKKRLSDREKEIDIPRAEISLARALNRLKYAGK